MFGIIAGIIIGVLTDVIVRKWRVRQGHATAIRNDWKLAVTIIMVLSIVVTVLHQLLR